MVESAVQQCTHDDVQRIIVVLGKPTEKLNISTTEAIIDSRRQEAKARGVLETQEIMHSEKRGKAPPFDRWSSLA